MTLEKGKHYSKSELGIPQAQFRRSSAKTQDGDFFFFTIKNNQGHQNELQWDGIVVGGEDYLTPYGPQNDKSHHGRRIMVRYNATPTKYEYVGDEDYIIRYDAKRNKIVFKQDPQNANP